MKRTIVQELNSPLNELTSKHWAGSSAHRTDPRISSIQNQFYTQFQKLIVELENIEPVLEKQFQLQFFLEQQFYISTKFNSKAQLLCLMSRYQLREDLLVCTNSFLALELKYYEKLQFYTWFYNLKCRTSSMKIDVELGQN